MTLVDEQQDRLEEEKVEDLCERRECFEDQSKVNLVTQEPKSGFAIIRSQ